MEENFLLYKMSWPEIAEKLKENPIVLVPIGSTEQHGMHLPIDNDAYTAFEFAKKIAEKASKEVPVLVAPLIPYGVSQHHMNFPGTVTLRTKTLAHVLEEVCKSLIHHGFKKIVIVNGHGGNITAINMALQKVGEETDAFLAVINWWEIAIDVISKLAETPFFHACETETSVALALDQKVNMEKAKGEVPTTPSKFIKFDFLAPPPKISTSIPSLDKLTKTGSVGDPTKASREKGEKIISVVIERAVEFLKEVAKI